jgi:hypothetical protein
MRSSAARAAVTQASMFSASFKQGMTTDTNGVPAVWSSASEGMLVRVTAFISFAVASRALGSSVEPCRL